MTTITRQDSTEGRTYTITLPEQQVTWPSVTTILKALAKDALPNWAAKVTREGIASLVRDGIPPETLTDQQRIAEALKENGLRHNDVRDSAAEKGTGIHHLLESLCAGLPIVAETGHAKALKSWWDATKPEVVESEIQVYSVRGEYAGTTDLITLTELLDLKTGNAKRRPYDSDFLQVAAYRRAWREMTGFNLRPGVLICRENGTYETAYSPDPDADEQAFLALYEVWRWRISRGFR